MDREWRNGDNCYTFKHMTDDDGETDAEGFYTDEARSAATKSGSYFKGKGKENAEVYIQLTEAEEVEESGRSDGEYTLERDETDAEYGDEVRNVYVLFREGKATTSRGSRTCHEYIVGDLRTIISDDELIHVEVLFEEDSCMFTSAQNTDGVSVTERKMVMYNDYQRIIHIKLSAQRYYAALDMAKNILAVDHPYDSQYYYLYVCITLCGCACKNESRKDKYTCSRAAAILLRKMGICKEDITLRRTMDDNNITVDQLYRILVMSAKKKLAYGNAIIDVAQVKELPERFYFDYVK